MSNGASSIETLSASMQAFLERAGDERLGKNGEPAPVHLWDPPFCGALDMRIASDGTWHYEGGRIERPALVLLFASILRREPDGQHSLVTPVERYSIEVEDVAFSAVELEQDNSSGQLLVRTNMGEIVALGDGHDLRFVEDQASGGLKPYVHIRNGLEALMTRPVAYQLLDLVVEKTHDGEPWLGIESGNRFYPVLPVQQLKEADV